MEQLEKKSWLFKVALLSISILAMTAPSIAIAIPQMAKAFPQAGTNIDLISSLPNLGVILMLFVSNFMAKKLGIKTTVFIGLIIYLIGGIGPAFVNDVTVIYGLRFLLGCGIGTFNAFSVSIMYMFFKDKELSAMLGFQNTAQNLGNAVFGFLLAALIVGGWRVAFYGYAIALIPLVLFGLFVKIPSDSAVVEETSPEDKPQVVEKANAAVWLLTLFIVAVFSLWLIIIMKLPAHVIGGKIADESAISSILSFQGIAAMISSAFFGKLVQKFGHYMMIIALVGMALGYYITAISTNVTMVTCGAILAGLFFGWVFPSLFMRLGQEAPHSGNIGASFIMVGANLGSFLAPMLANAISPNMVVVFQVAAVAFLILAAIYFVSLRLSHK